jgi:Concanavalin A-like lectin/glucanases superfamily
MRMDAKKTGLLLVALSLWPATAGAQEMAPREWTPAYIRGCTYWLPTARLQHLKVESDANNNGAVTAAAADGDYVGQIDGPVFGHRTYSPSDALRPKLYSDGSRASALRFFGDAVQSQLLVINSKGAFRHVHTTECFTIGAWIRPEGTTSTIAANTDQISNHAGWVFQRTNLSKIKFQLWDGTQAVAAVTSTNTPASNTWTYVVVTGAGPGSGKIALNVGGTITTGDLTASAASLSTDSNANLAIGNGVSPAATWKGELADLFICSAVISADDLARYVAYNPPRTTRPAVRVVRNDIELDPEDVQPIWANWDFSRQDTLFKADGTTAVAADGDPIGLVRNTLSSTSTSLSRDLVQTTTANCPLWKLGQQNGLPASLFAGTDDIENNLSVQVPPQGDRTLFWIGKQTNDSDGLAGPIGSHMLMVGTIGSDGIYLGVTGNHDSAATHVFQHTTDPGQGSSDNFLGGITGIDPLIVEEVYQGSSWKMFVNGYQLSSFSIVQSGSPSIWPTTWNQAYAVINIGRSAHPPGTGRSANDQWGLRGNCYQVVIFPSALTPEIRRKLRLGFRHKWAIPNCNTSS